MNDAEVTLVVGRALCRCHAEPVHPGRVLVTAAYNPQKGCGVFGLLFSSEAGADIVERADPECDKVEVHGYETRCEGNRSVQRVIDIDNRDFLQAEFDRELEEKEILHDCAQIRKGRTDCFPRKEGPDKDRRDMAGTGCGNCRVHEPKTFFAILMDAMASFA
ncbi:MAG: hypothetical protein BWY20_01331 [Spirochaetes bacterium ADurb.Bin215]|nr:MAG: hypothetical protein BWY20_01331 [Spirochaetes bacterium ADurb.Bin215]